jgi:hypothetical protein
MQTQQKSGTSGALLIVNELMADQAEVKPLLSIALTFHV